MSFLDERKRAPKLTRRPCAMWSRGLSIALCGLALALWPVFLLGQEGETVTGMVKAQRGGLVSGAKVTLVNSDANTRPEAITGEDGSFSVKNVPPGSYLVQVKASPFEPFQSHRASGTSRDRKAGGAEDHPEIEKYRGRRGRAARSRRPAVPRNQHGLDQSGWELFYRTSAGKDSTLDEIIETAWQWHMTQSAGPALVGPTPVYTGKSEGA